MADTAELRSYIDRIVGDMDEEPPTRTVVRGHNFTPLR